MKFWMTSLALIAIGVAQVKGADVAKLPKYEKSKDAVAGDIKSVGSDTMDKLMTFWCEGFKEIYPNVKFEIEGKGSATAPPALIEKVATFGPMSRPMNKQEQDKFESAFGYKPTSVRAALDTLAVFVHKDNPIKGLSFQQLDAVFSKTRKQGGSNDAATWGDLGLTGKWKDQPINLYGRNAESGTYTYFKEHALKKGDYKATVKEQPGSAGVVQAVAGDVYGIGYSGIGFVNASVRALPLNPAAGTEFVEPTPANAYSGEYPMSRYLLIYLNYKPESQLDPLRREFIKFVLSSDGQALVEKDGFLPVKAKDAAAELKKLSIKLPEVAASK